MDFVIYKSHINYNIFCYFPIAISEVIIVSSEEEQEESQPRRRPGLRRRKSTRLVKTNPLMKVVAIGETEKIEISSGTSNEVSVYK